MDKLLQEIAHYVDTATFSSDAYDAAALALADSLGCAILALSSPACTALLGPLVDGTVVPHGCHIPGIKTPLDPFCGAFNLGMMIRWLDFNDTWLAKEWGHPSDNLGAILALADHLSRRGLPLRMVDVLHSLIIAYEIQGVLALSFSCNMVGLDHVYFVKIASAAVSARLLGGHFDQIANALSQAFIDGAPLRVYRQGTSTGSRKSWAAGDATARGLFLAHMTMMGEMGYPEAITATRWGLKDTLFKDQELTLAKPLGEYVIDHILFKVLHPAEYHAQTAVEAALILHPEVKNRLDDIEKIVVHTHASAIKIISKEGPLKNPADRDHCLQYMIAVPLITGQLNVRHYEDEFASDPRIDQIRSLIEVHEEPRFSTEYLEEGKRSAANQIQIFFKDGTETKKVLVEYPLGHKKRRQEAMPHLKDKLIANLHTHYPTDKTQTIVDIVSNRDELELLPVRSFMDLFT